jgi:hypothetical protein
VEPFKQFVKDVGADDSNIIDACMRTMEQGEKYLTKDTPNWYYDVESFRRGLLQRKVLRKTTVHGLTTRWRSASTATSCHAAATRGAERHG